MKKTILIAFAAMLLHVAAAQRTLLIKNVNVVDVEKGTLIKNVHVLLKDSVITQIITGKPDLKKANSVLEGGNRYLIPGLWDMHTHIWNDGTMFPLLIANGVTGVRDMGERSLAMMRNWSRDIAAGKKSGPVIVAAGPIVDGERPLWNGSATARNAAEGRRIVDSLKNILHTDFVKVYSYLSRDAYFGIADEARKQNFPFAGHVPQVVTVLEAAQAGQKSQEHLYGFIDAASDSANQFMEEIQKKPTESLLNIRPEKKRSLFRTFNLEKLQQVLQQMKKYDTWICPTMIANYSIAYMNDSNMRKDPRIQYMPLFLTNRWNPATDFRFESWTAETYSLLRQEFDLKLKVLRAIHEAGIPILAGSDLANPFIYPGFSLHDELQWMVKGGLTPAAALQTATILPARYLGWQARYGSVAADKIADLVLLDANPLIDIRNTQKIHTVIIHGKVFNKTVINSLLERAKETSGQKN
jgi:hypothetical protein